MASRAQLPTRAREATDAQAAFVSDPHGTLTWYLSPAGDHGATCVGGQAESSHPLLRDFLLLPAPGSS